MTDRDALIHRIAGAIARKTASAAPAAVLDELEATHVLVPRETDDRTRLATIMDLLTVEEVANISISMPWFGLRLAQASMPGDLDSIRHDAAESDTSVSN